jgi:hypothetical protein
MRSRYHDGPSRELPARASANRFTTATVHQEEPPVQLGFRRIFACLVAAVISIAVIGPAAAKRYDKTEKQVAGGTHWRFVTDSGPMHVWVPDYYDRDTAGLVVYVHGYWVDVDEAWKQHRLPQQFAQSRQNAMFVAIEAPRDNDDSVKWKALGDVKKAVARANFVLPDGPAIVVAHSGGFRTIKHWVDNKLLAQVILLDASYGGTEEFKEFIGTGKRAKYHKMVIIASGTAARARAFAKAFRFAVTRDGFPKKWEDFTRREVRSKLLYIRAHEGHSEIVSGGHVLPLALRLTPLERK